MLSTRHPWAPTMGTMLYRLDMDVICRLGRWLYDAVYKNYLVMCPPKVSCCLLPHWGLGDWGRQSQVQLCAVVCSCGSTGFTSTCGAFCSMQSVGNRLQALLAAAGYHTAEADMGQAFWHERFVFGLTDEAMKNLEAALFPMLGSLAEQAEEVRVVGMWLDGVHGGWWIVQSSAYKCCQMCTMCCRINPPHEHAPM